MSHLVPFVLYFNEVN